MHVIFLLVKGAITLVIGRTKHGQRQGKPVAIYEYLKPKVLIGDAGEVKLDKSFCAEVTSGQRVSSFALYFRA